jgi:putative transposase
MSDLRRYFYPGNICFITNATYDRMTILIDNNDLLFKAIENVREKTPFELIAWVILDDHFHFILDPLNNDPSRFLQRLKMSFAAYYRKRMNLYRGRVWQNRFWDHIIRDQDDLNRHIDYIHFNPVKHGYVSKPNDWQYSSFDEYHKNGVYPDDWGIVEPRHLEGDYGE